MKIYFNTPIRNNNNNDDDNLTETHITAETINFENCIEIQGQITFRELKEKISNVINIDKEEFIMRKYSYQGYEIKNLDEIIDTTTKSFLNIYIELGNPTNAYTLRVNIFTINTCDSCDNSKFSIFPYKLINNGFFTTDTRISINEFKLRILNEIKERNYTNLNSDLNKVLVREYKLEKPTKVIILIN